MVALNNVRKKILKSAFSIVIKGTSYVELKQFID
ncbi:MAG: hypothetical protein ACJA1P_002440 [Maribacter sp.]|jgi:hypothetical protein